MVSLGHNEWVHFVRYVTKCVMIKWLSEKFTATPRIIVVTGEVRQSKNNWVCLQNRRWLKEDNCECTMAVQSISNLILQNLYFRFIITNLLILTSIDISHSNLHQFTSWRKTVDISSRQCRTDAIFSQSMNQVDSLLWPLLLTWFNFNPSMNK